MTKPVKPERLDRHSGSGTRGLPKKEGAGKYGWGTAGDEATAPAALDPKDPNYEEQDEIPEVETTIETGAISEAR